MKKIINTILPVFLLNMAIAQTPIPEWANKIGSDSNDKVQVIDVDPLGNIYVAGKFSSSTLTIGTETLTNPYPGSFHVFIAKYNSSGSVLWARSGGSTSDDDVTAMAVVQEGVIVAGNFANGNVTFGSSTENHVGGYDMFLVKYDANGALEWLKVFGDSNNDKVYGVCFNLSGDIFITGGFTGSINFGTTALNAISSEDIFVTKLNSSNGTEIWAKSYGGSGSSLAENGTAIVADFQHAYVTGKFNSAKISFSPGDTLVNSSGVDEMFVLKLNGENGNTLWSVSAGGDCNEWPKSIDIDNLMSNGNIYISGFFSCTAYFGADSVTANGYTGGFSTISDAFVSKMDNDGNFLWVKKFGGISYDESYSCSVDYSGNVTVTVNSNSTGLSFASQSLSSFGQYDIYVLQYNQNGNEVWGRSYGTNSYEFIYSCKVNKQNNFPIYLGGSFGGPNIIFGSHTLTSDQSGDGYLVKLSQETTGLAQVEMNNSELFIYPNPSTDYLNIRTQNTGTIELFSVDGKMVDIVQINSAIQVYDVSDYPVGVYILRFTDCDGNIKQHRLIKQ